MTKILYLEFVENFVPQKLKDQFLINSQIFFRINEKSTLLLEELFFNTKDLFSLLKITKKQLKKDVTFSLKNRFFFNSFIKLKKGVFVPQFDSEIIVEVISKLNLGNTQKFLEIGVGTGAISIAIKKLKEKSLIKGIDISSKAINLSKINAKENNVEISFEKCDFFKYVTNEKYDLIISNPPYIQKGDIDIENWVKKNQPPKALYSKEKGLFFIKKLIDFYEMNSTEDGILIFEFGHEQEEKIIFLLKKYKYNFYKDLSSKNRVVLVEKIKNA